MRYRQLSATGDYQFGNVAPFLVDNADAVAQAISTRLKLLTGEWFLDSTIGLNTANILGVRTQGTRDLEVKSRILGTTGVKEITDYSSSVDSNARSFTVSATVSTIYGATTITETF